MSGRTRHALAHPARLAKTDWPRKPRHAPAGQIWLDAALPGYVPWHAVLAEIIRVNLEAAA